MEEKISYPWLTFRVNKGRYCLTSRNIVGIRQLDQVTPIPSAPQEVMGVYLQGDTPVPVINLRTLLGYIPYTMELEKLALDIETYKQDHLNWVSTLEHCTRSGEPFPLATDGHKCRFGKWLDSYKSSSLQVELLLKTIRDSHDELHKNAICCEKWDDTEREEKLQHISTLCHTNILPTMTRISQEISGSTTTMAVILEEGPQMCAVVVDEIYSTMTFKSRISKQIFGGLSNSRFIKNVLKSEDETMYLELSPFALLDYAASAQAQQLS